MIHTPIIFTSQHTQLWYTVEITLCNLHSHINFLTCIYHFEGISFKRNSEFSQQISDIFLSFNPLNPKND